MSLESLNFHKILLEVSLSKSLGANLVILGAQFKKMDCLVKTDGRVGSSINTLFVQSISRKKTPIYPSFLEERTGNQIRGSLLTLGQQPVQQPFENTKRLSVFKELNSAAQ